MTVEAAGAEVLGHAGNALFGDREEQLLFDLKRSSSVAGDSPTSRATSSSRSGPGRIGPAGGPRHRGWRHRKRSWAAETLSLLYNN